MSPRSGRTATLRRKLSLGIGTKVDETFVRLAFRQKPSKSAPDPDLFDRLGELAIFYDRADAEGRLFAPPPTARPRTHQTRDLPLGEQVDLSWQSAYVPIHPDYAATQSAHPQNQTCHARWLRHPPPAPAIICLHGWGGGSYGLESRLFPVQWLYERCGLDVLLPVMPFHAQRGSGRGGPGFPSPNPIRANEGFAQMVSDVRSLIVMLRERGAPHVGVMGMSLGGFTTALLATVEPELDFAIPMIPFGSLPNLLWTQSKRGASRRKAEAAGVSLPHFASAFAATTPLQRALKIDPDQVLIAAGERDRITPIEHAIDLHRHFEGSRWLSFPGSHLFQFGRRQAFRAMAKLMTEHDILPETQT